MTERDAITDGMPDWVQAAGWQARIAWNEDPAWRTRAQTARSIEQGALILRATMLYTPDTMAIVRPHKERRTELTEQAARDWHTRARVRIKETTATASPEGGQHTFHAGQELEMVQWGNAGRPVDRSAWWTSYDIDGAFIIKASKVEVVRIIEEEKPN